MQAVQEDFRSGLVDMHIRQGRWPVPVPVSLTGVDSATVHAVLTVMRGAGMPARAVHGEVVVSIAVKGKKLFHDTLSHKRGLEPQRGLRRVAFSSQQDNIFVRRYLGAGGTAVFLNEQGLVLARGGNWWLIESSPCTTPYPGFLSTVIIATAVCAGLDLGPEHIARGLQRLGVYWGEHQKYYLEQNNMLK